MWDRQDQNSDIPAHTRTAHRDPLQTRLEEDLCKIVSRVPLTAKSVKELN